ncbi:MAG: DUF4349 domain-containing protein [Actinomycetota bacterium]|nr:DUF4349 domain-containing protein [Actinomycetota bacterium]
MTRTPKQISKPLSTVVILVGLAATGCGLAGDGESGDGGAAIKQSRDGDHVPGPVPQPASGGDQPMGVPEAAGGAAILPRAGGSVPSVSASVIKTAQLELEVPKSEFDDAIRDAEAIAGRYGGFVFSTSVEEGEIRTGTVVIRVPSPEFEAALSDIKSAGELTEENVTGKDVSQEFIDLQARVRNLEAQEAVILELMKAAGSIPETIRVQNELSGIQLEIERLKGRLRFLEDRTSFGTIAVDFRQAGAPAPSKPNTFEEAWQQAVDVMVAIVSGLIVSLGFVVPIGILAGIVLLVFRQLRPRLTS